MSGIFGFVHVLVRMDREAETLSIYLSLTHIPSPCDGGMLKSSGTSEDSSSLCSIIHHLWLQNSVGSPWGCTLYPDGKTPVPLRACLLPRPQPCGPLEYTTSSFADMLTSEPSKINQKQTGASHLLISCSLALFGTTCWIKKSISETGSLLKSSSNDVILLVTKTIYSTVHCLPFVLSSKPKSLPTMIQYDPLSECSFVPA